MDAFIFLLLGATLPCPCYLTLPLTFSLPWSWDTYIWIIVIWSSPSYPNQFTGIASVSPKAPRLRDIVSHVRKYIHRGLFYWVHSWIYCGMLGYINIEISRTDAATVRRILCWSSVELWHLLRHAVRYHIVAGINGSQQWTLKLHSTFSYDDANRVCQCFPNSGNSQSLEARGDRNARRNTWAQLQMGFAILYVLWS